MKLSITPWIHAKTTTLHLACCSDTNMAITDTSPPVEVEILVNDVALQEYNDDDDDSVSAHTVVKYIEAVSGAEFAVRYRLDPKPSHDVSVDISLDGKWAVSRIIQLSHYPLAYIQKTITGVNSNKDGSWVLSKFSFSDLTIGT